jgi:hypothetical protein
MHNCTLLGPNNLQGMEKILQEGAEALGPEVVTLTGPNRYRPPAGFMNENIQEFPEVCRTQFPISIVAPASDCEAPGAGCTGRALSRPDWRW